MNDSVWAVIAGIVKAYNLPIDYVLYDLSYTNLVMYGAVIPSSRGGRSTEEGEGEEKGVINADDPKNRDKVRQYLDSIE